MIRFLLVSLIFVSGISHARFTTIDEIITGRFEGGDLVSDRDGDGQDSSIVNAAPTISLTGAAVVTYTEGDSYSELGATCTDPEDSTIAVPAPVFSPSLDMNTAGSYVATYTCTDTGGLTDQTTRTVNVNTPVTQGQLAFSDVTTSWITNDGGLSLNFGLAAVDANADGYTDIFVTDHGEGGCGNSGRRFLISNGTTFTAHYDDDCTNFNQDSPIVPASKSRFIFGNWCGNPNGLPSFYGNDVDGSNGALYCRDDSDAIGGLPSFQAKRSACDRAGTVCYPLEFNGDGNIEFVRNYQSQLGGATTVTQAKGDLATDDETFKIINPIDGSEIVPGVDDMWGSTLLVFDVDNDSYPDAVYPYDRGWFKNNSGASFTFQPLTIDDNPRLLDPQYNSSVNYTLAADFDADGYMDLAVGRVPYNIEAIPGLTFILYRNNGDGTFADVSAPSGLHNGEIIPQNDTTPYEQYGNASVVDINNDGYPDILLSNVDYPRTAAIAVNNGDLTFSLHEFIFGGSHGAPCGVYYGMPWITASDLDRDGDADIVVNACTSIETNANVKIWRNDSDTGNWLSFKLRGAGNNTDGLHTKITVKEPGTENIITSVQTGYYGQGQETYMYPHLGVGENSAVDIEISWPHSGETYVYSSVSTNRDLIAFRDGCLITDWAPGSGWPLDSAGQTCLQPDIAAVNTTVTLTADAGITATNSELVTFGLPIAEGLVTDSNEIKVSVAGSEVPAYVEPGLAYHWSDNSIRSVTIQLQNVDMSGGDVVVTITDEGFSVPRLTQMPHSNGWATAAADKNNLPYPRIFALHEPQYLADTRIIPPFKPSQGDGFEDYQVAQFNNNFGGLDYSSSSNSAWLFDRSSAMFKVYMSTGRVEFLKEAFLSKQFYFGYVRNDGTPPDNAGGDGCWTYNGTACADSKYISPQPAKLALALVGDDSQWDNSLINEMAIQADLGWNQYGTRDTFDAENEGFTERAAGLTGLAEINAYEITGDATVLSNLNDRISSLKDMQQTVKAWDTANGWVPKSGAFTHNVKVHEGVCSEGTCPIGETNARGFSPWMSENIVDFLWHTYWVTGHGDIPAMLSQLANAVDSYGFTSVYNTGTGQHDRLAEFPTPVRVQSCNTTGADTEMLYLTSSFADNATRTSGDWWPWYTDNHNIETILTLSAGYYFETDNNVKTRLQARIDKLVSGWTNENCAAVFSGVYRLFNWQHRSNSVRTWHWVAEQ